MSYSNAAEFYNEIRINVQNYCSGKIKICNFTFWSPKRFESANKLLDNLQPNDSKSKLLKKVYESYYDLLKINSKDPLVNCLARLLAKELNISMAEVTDYLELRRNYIRINSYRNCIVSIPSFFQKSNIKGIDFELKDAKKDPIPLAYTDYIAKMKIKDFLTKKLGAVYNSL
jgi:hypothetical protein